MKFNKAAMFGLDARIALAIFGALSVISGAALYSAIQEAKNEQIRQGLVELVKASEQYYLDNGQMIPQQGSIMLYIADLIENRESLATWNGPYIPADKIDAIGIDTITSKVIDDTFYMAAALQKASTWPSSSTWATCVLNDVDCSEWIYIYNGKTAAGYTKAIALFNRLDKFMDNGDGATTGNLRMIDLGLNDVRIFYKSISRKRII